MRILPLSILNFFVMGSTFLFFSTSIRVAESEVAANFILFGLALSISSLISDSGKTNLAFRQTIRDPNLKEENYSVLLHIRLRRNLAIQILAFPFFMFKGVGISSWIIFLLVSTIVLVYSVGLSLAQADESYNFVYLIQTLNFLGFILATYFLSKIDGPSLTTILIHLVAAWIPTCLSILKTFSKLISAPKKNVTRPEDERHFSKIMYANVITLNYNQFILGMFSTNLLTLYTVSSMPIIMLMPISASLSILTSHKFKSQKFETSRRQIMRALYFLPLALVVASFSTPLISGALGLFFGEQHINESIVMIQMFSAILSLYTGLFGSLYSVALLSKVNKKIAVSQALIILLIGTVGGYLHLVLIVAFSELISRAIGLFFAMQSTSTQGGAEG